MNQAVSPLQQLPPIAVPDAIDSMAIAPGWWILAALFIAVMIAMAAVLAIHHHFRAPLREARQLLGQYYQQWQLQGDDIEFLRQCNMLLRRVALHYHPRRVQQSSHGETWLQELDSCAHNVSWNCHAGRQLLLQYQPKQDIDLDIDALHQLAQQWLAKQKLSSPLQQPKALKEQADV